MNEMNQETKTTKLSNVLLIGSMPKTIDAIRASLEAENYVVEHIASVSEFKTTVQKDSFDLIVTATDSSKFTSSDLFEMVMLLTPETPVVGYTEKPDPTQIIEFVRLGGVDFFCIPEDLQAIAGRAQTVIESAVEVADLKESADANARLYNSVTEELQRVSDENDSLCNDLANTHCETDKKMKQVAIGAEFQTLVNQELEVESMLRTALGYMLTRIGATNAAVYLREGEIDWGIGAYINYDRQAEQFQSLIDTLGPIVCPTVSCETGTKRYKDGEVFATTVDADPIDFSGSEVVTVSCFHEERCMAVLVLFRGDTRPFGEEAMDTIETIREIFGTQLGTILKIHRRAETTWPSEFIDDDDWSQGKAA
jgi:DNA-binding response OmpR family regulator